MEDNGLPRQKWKVVGLLCLIAAINYTDRTAISTVLPALRADLHLSDVQMGAAGTCFLWSYAVGCPFAGYLADRLSRSRLIFWSLLLWSVITFATSFAHNVTELLTLRVLLGLVESAYLPSALALIGDYHGPKTRATAMGIHLAGLNLGVVGGGVAVGAIGQTYGWRPAFLWMGGLGCLLAIITGFYLRDPLRQRSNKIQDSSPLALFRTPIGMIVAAEMAIVAMGTWVFFNWLPLYFSEVHHMNLAAAGFSGTFFLQIPAAVGVAAGGKFSDMVARKNPRSRLLILAVGLIIAAPFLLVFKFKIGVTMISMCLLFYSLFRTLGAANEEPILSDILKPKERGSAFGIINGANNVMGGAAVLASGFIKERIGLNDLFLCIVFVLLAAGLLCLFGYHRWGKDNASYPLRLEPEQTPVVS